MAQRGLRFFICLFGFAAFQGCNREQPVADYPFQPVPFNEVALSDRFWMPAIVRNTEITIPIAFRQSEETGRIANFEVAGGIKEGAFASSYPFDDSDVFKIIEGAAYSLSVRYDPLLDAYLDTLVQKIALAQEEDGYLYTNRTIMKSNAHDMAGSERWLNVSEHSHELYNMGHLYEAAAAHFRATGKRTLLDVALKNAALIEEVFGPGKLELYPGHQEIEMGLVKLFRITGDKRYLDLAGFFLDTRGPDGWEYNQAHLKPADQTEPVGHAVRAMYMYAGMADVAALTGNKGYEAALEKIWSKLVDTKYYITGGVGQKSDNEGFGPDYHLPDRSAYCETCASIAFVFWNHRMFLLHGRSKYIDVLERTLYNALLSGVSQSGDSFFYSNPLLSKGEHHRKPWFGCACCPSNISRFLPSAPGYIFAGRGNDIFINLFISAETAFRNGMAQTVLRMESGLPHTGAVSLYIDPETPVHHNLHIRIPGWVKQEAVPGDLYTFASGSGKMTTILINGSETSFNMQNGYAVVSRKWQKGDHVQIVFPMEVKAVAAHPLVTEMAGMIALQYGPLVYCVEDKDNPGVDIHSLLVLPEMNYTPVFDASFFSGATTIGLFAIDRNKPQDTLQIKAIPYYLWANRGAGDMRVWLPVR